MENGKIIVIEAACDGCGKTTQKELIEKKLNESNKSFISYHFPSKDKPQGLLVQKYLKGDFGKREENDPNFVNFLFAMDRSVTWNEELRKNYNNGDVILLDRYTTSSLIYQSAEYETDEEKKAFIDRVIKFEYENLKIGVPDVVIFLYAPFDVIKMLRNKRNQERIDQGKDIFEEDEEYLKKVYDNSFFVAKYLDWEMVNCMDGNRLKTPKEINEQISLILENKLDISFKKKLK